MLSRPWAPAKAASFIRRSSSSKRALAFWEAGTKATVEKQAGLGLSGWGSTFKTN